MQKITVKELANILSVSLRTASKINKKIKTECKTDILTMEHVRIYLKLPAINSK